MTVIGGILVLFIYITRLASNEIFSPSNKIHREVGRAKDLSAPRYMGLKAEKAAQNYIFGSFPVCTLRQVILG